MFCCNECTKTVNKLFPRHVEEKSGPGAIFGKFRCEICQKSFDVQVDSRHNLNFWDDAVEIIMRVRAELGISVRCPLCEQLADKAAGKATKCVIVFHNCGRPN